MAGFSFRSNTTMHMFILDEKFVNFICRYTQHVDIRLIYPHRITGTQSPIFFSFFKHVCMLLPALSMQSKTLSVIVCALWFMFLPMLFFFANNPETLRYGVDLCTTRQHWESPGNLHVIVL